MNAVEEAIHCFETLTPLRVSVHDLRLRLWQHLPWHRFIHNHPLCQQVKEREIGRQRCVQFEVERFRAEAHRYHEGRVHRCHAGLVEIAQPVLDEEGLLAVLFAGPFRVTDTAGLQHEDDPGVQVKNGSLPCLAAGQVSLYRECLRQLGSRLRCLGLDQAARAEPATASRRQRIEGYLSRHLAAPLQVADLARVLNLSPDRCRHVVREICGVGFARLLRQIRLKSATSLLLNTELTIDQVAERCGLSDPSGFSRAFRQAYGLSPGRWRKQNRG